MGETIDRDTVSALLGARQALYALLARCWDAPLDEAALSLMRSSDLEMLCRMMDDGVDDGIASLDDLRVRLVAEIGARGLDDVERAFNWCFLGIGTRVAPWESVYVSSDRLVFQASTLAVREAYGVAGFVAKNKGSEPDDHIATECDFMAKLAAQAAGAFAAQDEDECRRALRSSQSFLRDHLGVFAEDFAESFAEAASKVQEDAGGVVACALALYGTLAQFSQVFFKADAALLQELAATL
ncbi:molecular chaperone [uncultured Adlercreutzia sp.]|uniref:TorD/DmsD family molecular chaperone n=1 Tax=uncultured Adlercreutzia sp. TaxID=875803 RepID=UPI0026757752|nr:molecular chaperone TorD family protein [uncultured Adlercreutzia sp.]